MNVALIGYGDPDWRFDADRILDHMKGAQETET